MEGTYCSCRPLDGPRSMGCGELVEATTNMATPANTIRFIRLPEVIRISGLSRSQIYRLCGAGHFPQSVKLGEATTAWVESEVQQWCTDQVAAARRQVVAA